MRCLARPRWRSRSTRRSTRRSIRTPPTSSARSTSCDGELDVGAWARDQLALALPDQILCRPDCAGLCPVCGKNLNVEPHEHEEASPTRAGPPSRRCGRTPPARLSRGAGLPRARSRYHGPSLMAVPKRKTSKSRRDKRRAQHGIAAPRVVDVRAVRLAEAVPSRLPDVQDVSRARGQASPHARSLATWRRASRSTPSAVTTPRMRSSPAQSRRPRTRSRRSSSGPSRSPAPGSSSSRAATGSRWTRSRPRRCARSPTRRSSAPSARSGTATPRPSSPRGTRAPCSPPRCCTCGACPASSGPASRS